MYTGMGYGSSGTDSDGLSTVLYSIIYPVCSIARKACHVCRRRMVIMHVRPSSTMKIPGTYGSDFLVSGAPRSEVVCFLPDGSEIGRKLKMSGSL